jgi:2-polyprenyl-3-methyl-5-hydroxy-6-metoxy-1,4-benzoquinol methylase
MLDLSRFDDGSFDIVTCFEALEHIVEHDALLDGVCRVLRDDGIFVTSTPVTISANSRWRSFARWLIRASHTRATSDRP